MQLREIEAPLLLLLHTRNKVCDKVGCTVVEKEAAVSRFSKVYPLEPYIKSLTRERSKEIPTFVLPR